MRVRRTNMPLVRIEPFLPVLLGAHGCLAALLTTSPASTVAVGLSAVALVLGVAGLAGWRGATATLVRGSACLAVAFAVQVISPELVPAYLQWYYVVAAGYGLLLRGWPAAAVGPAAAACYLLQVALGAGAVPVFVAVLRAGVIVALGLLMFAAGRAYRAQRHSAVEGRTVAEAARTELAHAANHDALTGLPNRVAFLEAVAGAQRASGAPQDDETGAVLLVGLDRFKTVNDALGREAGDQLLVDVAARLDTAATDGALVCRLGSDEFAVVLRGAAAMRSATDVAERLRRLLAEPFDVEGREHLVTASVAVAPLRAGAPGSSVLRMADVALAEAKRGGRDRVVVYDTRLAQVAEQRLGLEQDLRTAVRRGQVTAVYQPIVSVGSRRLLGVEVLARWQRDGVAVPPDVFIPMAEAMGVIGELGSHVLDQSAAALARWRRREVGVGYVAVNVSPVQLRDEHFPSRVAEVLERHGVRPSELVLEVTESAVMDDESAVTPMLVALRDLGVKISMDDFGTGYSSLARLRNLPVSELKVDRSFVAELGQDDTVTTLVLDLARRLGLRTIAEGVETSAQLAALGELGCDAAQGYLIARPMTEAALVAWVETAAAGGRGVARRLPVLDTPRG